MKNIDIFTKNYPHLDLHGEYTSTIYTLIDEFITDNLKLGNRYLVIIHGKNDHGRGRYILKNKLYEILKDDKRVVDYKLLSNLGSSLIEIKLDK